MAFVALPSLGLRWRGRAPLQERPSWRKSRQSLRVRIVATGVESADAMQFFRHREGTWDSWRVTHHLAFRRAESGESKISMKCLEKTDERVVSLCNDWKVDPMKAQGGCYVTWMATLAWDKEGENHEGSTVFALVPDEDDIRKGRILRDRGYAEIVPIAGTYALDEHGNLKLNTPYEGGEVVETFSFDGTDIVNRVSTVCRFGGFSTATFATETRIREGEEEESTGEDYSVEEIEEMLQDMSFFRGEVSEEDIAKEEVKKRTQFVGAGRWGTRNVTGKPSANSAFASSFGGGAAREPSTPISNAKADDIGSDISKKALDAAQQAGIDLSKVPPSMRKDFAASFETGEDKSE